MTKQSFQPDRRLRRTDPSRRVRALRTAELANAAGVHPNTVRLYEAWGLLPKAARSASGYRLFTERHLALLLLARTALAGPFPGRRLRRSATGLIRLAASDPRGAAAALPRHLALVRAERREAEAAAAVLESWAREGGSAQAEAPGLRIADAARLLAVSADMLRNWERNGLLRVPREVRSRYRLYGPAELARATVIRTLLRAGYSTMAVLRMFRRFDRGLRRGLKRALDTPRAGEDLVSATDRWLTTLADAERRARSMRGLLAALPADERRPS